MQNNATRAILKELMSLQKDPIEDVTVCPSEDGSTEQVEAIICGSEGTPYEGGQFKIRLTFGSDFPQSPPKGFFLTKIFHPNVSKAGDICVNTLKKDWNEKLGLRHVLLTIRCLLIQPNPESALNEEAGKLLLEDYDEYSKQAKLMTQIHASRVLVAPTQDENATKEVATKKSATKKSATKSETKKKGQQALKKKSLKRL